MTISTHADAAAPSTVSDLAGAAMTLCGLAYAFPEDIPIYLGEPSLATRGRWRATWVPDERDGFFAYAAVEQDTGTCAVAVRGTNPGATLEFIENVLNDIDVFRSRRWDPKIADGAMISNGARAGLEVLLTLTAGGETLAQHLERLPASTPIVVTGHSLGGCLASVLAFRLFGMLTGRSIRPITFAAPSAGNEKFCDVVQQAFPHAERYFNRLDLVPMAWHDLDRLGKLYDAPGPRCPAAFADVVALARGRLQGLGYTQPGPGIALPLDGQPEIRHAGEGLAARVGAWLGRHLYFAEALHQHMPDTYLDHLGAARLPFRMPLNWLWRKLKRTLMPWTRRASAPA
jgi:hypothetical protein